LKHFALVVAVIAAILSQGCASVRPTPIPTAESITPSASAGQVVTPSVTPSPSLPTPEAMSLTVMSYNTLTGKNDCGGCKALQKAGDGDQLELSQRMPKVAQRINLAAPDIIGFQENEGSEKLPAAWLQELLPDYTWILPERTVPIAVKEDRFTVLDHGILVLEEDYAPCAASDKTTGRYVVWAQLGERDSGRVVWAFNTHARPVNELACAERRSANLDKLIALIQEHHTDGEPLVITGDFNSFHNETREVFRDHLTKLAAVGIADSWQLAEADESDVADADSANWMAAPVDGKSVSRVIRRDGLHLDYVFVPDGTRVTSWQVLSGPGVAWKKISGESVPYWPGVMASDHSPVVTKLIFA
jgi:endonuclease/exonuclease/phosphatase family metal-dependent hydrolase